MKAQWREWKVVSGSYDMDYGNEPGWYASAYFAPKAHGVASWDELGDYRAAEGTTVWGAGPFETQNDAFAWVDSKGLTVNGVGFCTQLQVDSHNAWREQHKAAFHEEIDKLLRWEAEHGGEHNA